MTVSAPPERTSPTISTGTTPIVRIRAWSGLRQMKSIWLPCQRYSRPHKMTFPVHPEHLLQSARNPLINREMLFKQTGPLLPLITENKESELFRRCEPAGIMLEITKRWIAGQPYYELLSMVKEVGATRPYGKRIHNLD